MKKLVEVQNDDVPPRLVLILGGARSGKSTFAERLALESERRVAFIATATASDDDMRDRIARHQAARPAHWQTIEEPLHLATAVRQAAEHADVILLDCLTVWLSNWLFAQHDSDAPFDEQMISAGYYDAALQEIAELLQVASTFAPGKTLLCVSNEVGLGIVPAYALGRVYRDVLGLVNQRVATAAARVYLMVAGLGVDIKRLHETATL
ncbi:bifunctional adenosylcobinamide kinase/adenosylcobinamide-phosphate guanylyltransferase [Dictyobacter arantiisoli]|uniref:Adenosylcobinamide kinase n=1 Tax=Dictyobacter arantiisoli TaxID=2014874 RepID=A0A5A5TFC7_9CHLR|nr:bifunctional adenosylcobinamide kinase/adenosylcobinamide-phosphate guanylyltransferase [Dictyobacter arantiisoli]GCF10122.1 adenosylcobinamide kinase/adenosylcobinamide phosphate guanyltransferase [Dictyobacter arantiisoli]